MRRWVLVVLTVLVAMVMLPPAFAGANPNLISPADGVTVTNNTNGATAWAPQLTWDYDSNSESPLFYFEISSSPQVNNTTGFFSSQPIFTSNLWPWTTYDSTKDPANFPWCLNPGTYYWHVQDDNLTGSWWFWSPVYSFTVPDAKAAHLTLKVSQPSITWSVNKGDANPATQTLVIDTNPSGPIYNWSGDFSSAASWLTIDQPSLTSLSFGANVGNLAVGTYTTTMTVTAWSGTTQTNPLVGSPVQVPITLKVHGSSAPGMPPIPPKVVLPVVPPWAYMRYVHIQGVGVGMPKVSGSATHKKQTKFVGTISRALNLMVTVTIKRKLHGKFKAYKSFTTKASAATKSWSLKVKLPKGTFQLQAKTPRMGLYLAGASAWRTVKIK